MIECIKLGRHDFCRLMSNREITYSSPLPSTPEFRGVPVICDPNLNDYGMIVVYQFEDVMFLLNKIDVLTEEKK